MVYVNQKRNDKDEWHSLRHNKLNILLAIHSNESLNQTTLKGIILFSYMS